MYFHYEKCKEGSKKPHSVYLLVKLIDDIAILLSPSPEIAIKLSLKSIPPISLPANPACRASIQNIIAVILLVMIGCVGFTRPSCAELEYSSTGVIHADIGAVFARWRVDVETQILRGAGRCPRSRWAPYLRATRVEQRPSIGRYIRF